ncbi:MAG: hydrolase [Proteobacteria bacterium]|nr:hydrolase [Pseudomonadota bacterium]
MLLFRAGSPKTLRLRLQSDNVCSLNLKIRRIAMFVRMIFLTAFSATLAVCAHRSSTDASGSQGFLQKKAQERRDRRQKEDSASMGPNFESREIESQGKNRNYLLYTPAGRKDSSMPLVIGFHGGKTTNVRFARTTLFHNLADEQGFHVVYPSGINSNWNDGRGTANPDVDDISFVRALIEDVKAVRKIDARRIYVTGISNGGFMVQRLACDLSDRIAAFAGVAGSMGVSLRENCKSARPVPMLVMNSPLDKFVMWDGGNMTKGAGGDILSVPDVVDFWRKQNGCSGKKEEILPKKVASDKTKIVVTRHTGCQNNSALLLYKIEGGGHTWPDGADQPAWLVGPTSKELNATKEIWNFFRQHSL